MAIDWDRVGPSKRKPSKVDNAMARDMFGALALVDTAATVERVSAMIGGMVYLFNAQINGLPTEEAVERAKEFSQSITDCMGILFLDSESMPTDSPLLTMYQEYTKDLDERKDFIQKEIVGSVAVSGKVDAVKLRGIIVKESSSFRKGLIKSLERWIKEEEGGRSPFAGDTAFNTKYCKRLPRHDSGIPSELRSSEVRLSCHKPDGSKVDYHNVFPAAVTFHGTTEVPDCDELGEIAESWRREIRGGGQ